jgi:microcystin-dependent protein
VPISENEALFNLIGTTYGGDGQNTFNLPDLQGRMPIHMGQGPGISNNYVIGESGGVESVTLTTSQLPAHTHPALCSNQTGTQPNPANGVWAASTQNQYTSNLSTQAVNPTLVGGDGGSQPHDNMMPFLVISFIISLFGIFPSQN